MTSLFPITGDVSCDYVVRVISPSSCLSSYRSCYNEYGFCGKIFGTFKCPAAQHTLSHYF